MVTTGCGRCASGGPYRARTSRSVIAAGAYRPSAPLNFEEPPKPGDRRAQQVREFRDGTCIRIDRVADRRYWSGKHRCYEVNVQAIISPEGDPIWTSPGLPGVTHT